MRGIVLVPCATVWFLLIFSTCCYFFRWVEKASSSHIHQLVVQVCPGSSRCIHHSTSGALGCSLGLLPLVKGAHVGDFIWSCLSFWDLTTGRGAGLLWTSAAPANRDGGVWMCPKLWCPVTGDRNAAHAASAVSPTNFVWEPFYVWVFRGLGYSWNGTKWTF